MRATEKLELIQNIAVKLQQGYTFNEIYAFFDLLKWLGR